MRIQNNCIICSTPFILDSLAGHAMNQMHCFNSVCVVRLAQIEQRHKDHINFQKAMGNQKPEMSKDEIKDAVREVLREKVHPEKQKENIKQSDAFKDLSDIIGKNITLNKKHAAVTGIIVGMFFKTYLIAAAAGAAVLYLMKKMND